MTIIRSYEALRLRVWAHFENLGYSHHWLLMRIHHLCLRRRWFKIWTSNLKIIFKYNEAWYFPQYRSFCERFFRAKRYFRIWSVLNENFNFFKQFLDTQCTRIGGTCLNWDYYICTAGWETGLCQLQWSRLSKHRREMSAQFKQVLIWWLSGWSMWRTSW